MFGHVDGSSGSRAIPQGGSPSIAPSGAFRPEPDRVLGAHSSNPSTNTREPVIHLTRLGQRETFLLNPDLFERIDSHVDTVVRLTNGNEYVVSESAAEIIERIVFFRASVLAAGFQMQDLGAPVPSGQRRAELELGTREQNGSASTNVGGTQG
jgi:flagellar protein FlbD